MQRAALLIAVVLAAGAAQAVDTSGFERMQLSQWADILH
jgi:hypothetical protein